MKQRASLRFGGIDAIHTDCRRIGRRPADGTNDRRRTLTIRAAAVLAALIGLALVYATDQIVPAGTDRQAQLRLWLAARSAGIVAYLLLTFQVALGLILSHPTNKSTWKLSKTLFPWHDQLWVFIAAFVGAHVLAIVLDPYAGVETGGAFIPGLSEYRNVPVALGTLALYAFLVTTHHRALYAAAAARHVAGPAPTRAGRARSGVGARRPCRLGQRGARAALPLDRAGRPRRRGLPLLDRPPAPLGARRATEVASR